MIRLIFVVFICEILLNHNVMSFSSLKRTTSHSLYHLIMTTLALHNSGMMQECTVATLPQPIKEQHK